MIDVDVLSLAAGAAAYQGIDRAMDDLLEEERYARGAAERALLSERVADLTDSLNELRDDRDDVDYVNAIQFASEPSPEWQDYVGQDALKMRLRVAIESAKKRGVPLDHVLLASGMPGVGKTTMARIIANEMGGKIIELVPPFSIETLAKAARDLGDGDVLFIDEIHKLADNGKRGAEILLKLLEERVLFLGYECVRLNQITVIGATTDVDMLPEPVIDRFKIKPYFEKYSIMDLISITCRFMGRHGYKFQPGTTDDDLIEGIAEACRSTPRVCEEFVMAARDLEAVGNRKPTIEEVLAFQQVEPDGMTRQHIAYLITMYTQGRRTMASGEVHYIAGEALLRSNLRETANGIQRIERFLMELGFVERTPSGRRLTPDGIDTADYYLNR